MKLMEILNWKASAQCMRSSSSRMSATPRTPWWPRMARTSSAKTCWSSSPRASQTAAAAATAATGTAATAATGTATAAAADPWTALSVGGRATSPEIAPSATGAVDAIAIAATVATEGGMTRDATDVAPEATVHVRDHDRHRMAAAEWRLLSTSWDHGWTYLDSKSFSSFLQLFYEILFQIPKPYNFWNQLIEFYKIMWYDTLKIFWIFL